MAKRGQGEGSIHWHEGRQRWTAIATLGYDPSGKRIRKYVYGRTKTEARARLRELLRDAQDGVAIVDERCTVEEAVRDWLDHGLGTAGESARAPNPHLAEGPVIPHRRGRPPPDLQ